MSNERITKAGVKLHLRLLRSDDIAYVMSSWLKTHRDSQIGRQLDERAFYALNRPAIDHLINDPTLIRSVVTVDDDDTMIAGFVIADVMGPILHYLHVRGSFRGLGVAHVLLDHVGICRLLPFACTFDTRDLRRAINNGWPIKLRPELLETALGGTTR